MLTWWDLMGLVVKSLVFALVISVIACDQGLNCKGGAEGVGLATTTAVRLSVVFVLLSDLVLTSFLNIGWGLIK